MDLLPPGSWDAHLHLPPASSSFTGAELAGQLVKSHPSYHYVLTQSVSDKSPESIMSTLPGIQSMKREGRATIMLDPSEMSTSRLRTLASQGARSVRVHIAKISVDYGADIKNVERVITDTAQALHQAGLKWPITAQLSLNTWAKLTGAIEKLHDEFGTTFIADHMFCATPDTADSEALAMCLGMVDKGIVYVKVSGMAKYAPEGHERLKPTMLRVLRCQNGGMALWGSDWPHADMEGNMSEVDEEAQLNLLKSICDEMGQGYWEKLTRDNAARVYA
jgi:predicted TIM-barrel fold metal-dependent hydrolase